MIWFTMDRLGEVVSWKPNQTSFRCETSMLDALPGAAKGLGLSLGGGIMYQPTRSHIDKINGAEGAELCKYGTAMLYMLSAA